MSAPTYTASCSCGRWTKTGTADELQSLVMRHDDAPWRRHIVSILPCGRKRDADFERARLARVAKLEPSGDGAR